jgi:membrane associated rhomboid family serine protease
VVLATLDYGLIPSWLLHGMRDGPIELPRLGTAMLHLPAWALLGLWFVSQFFIPLESGVAWMAHVGGFLAAYGLARVVARPPGGPGWRAAVANTHRQAASPLGVALAVGRA